LIGLWLLAGCASKRVYRQPPPATDPAADGAVEEGASDQRREPPRSRPPAEAVALGIRVANLARDQVGRPYRWGGETPGEGFDCSGLVHWSYGCVGVGMPRVVRRQQEMGLRITGDRLLPGDLVFFAIDGRRTTHVGIYVGDQRFVHAPSSGQPVRVDSLADTWWRRRWTESRRVIDG
jgi:cell wall-associated NlpC family hydrolase